MYEVKNISGKLIQLSELGNVRLIPNQKIDLETVADRPAIESSKTLRSAIRSGLVKLLRHTLFKGPLLTNEDANVVQQKVEDAVRQATSEQNDKIEQTADRTVKTVRDLIDSLREQINSVGRTTVQQPIYINQVRAEGTKEVEEVDSKLMAELRSKDTIALTQQIETSGEQPAVTKVVKVSGKKITDLAKEL